MSAWGANERLIQKYGLAGDPIRPLPEILAAEQEFFDKVWFNRHKNREVRIEAGETDIAPEIWERAQAAAAEVLGRYGAEELGPWSDFEWGMINGKLSALRWVIGDDWDMLDT